VSKQNTERVSQPSDLSPDQMARLIDGLSRGNDPSTTCYVCGVSPDMYDRWMQKGAEATRGQYAEFHRDMKAAEAEAERFAVEAWRDQLDGSWTACRDFLKLRFPERWGSREAKAEPLTLQVLLPEPDDAL